MAIIKKRLSSVSFLVIFGFTNGGSRWWFTGAWSVIQWNKSPHTVNVEAGFIKGSKVCLWEKYVSDCLEPRDRFHSVFMRVFICMRLLCVYLPSVIAFSAGGVRIVRPSGREWCRCWYRGYRLQVWCGTNTCAHLHAVSAAGMSRHPVPLLRLVQAPGARFSPANQLAQTQAAAGGTARHHRERGRWRAEPPVTPLEPQAESWQSAQQDYTWGKEAGGANLPIPTGRKIPILVLVIPIGT